MAMEIGAFFENVIITFVLVITFIILILIFLYMIYGKEETTPTTPKTEPKTKT